MTAPVILLGHVTGQCFRVAESIRYLGVLLCFQSSQESSPEWLVLFFLIIDKIPNNIMWFLINLQFGHHSFHILQGTCYVLLIQIQLSWEGNTLLEYPLARSKNGQRIIDRFPLQDSLPLGPKVRSPFCLGVVVGEVLLNTREVLSTVIQNSLILF